MKLDVTTLEGAKAGSVDLNEAIFGLEPRADLLAVASAGSSQSARPVRTPSRIVRSIGRRRRSTSEGHR